MNPVIDFNASIALTVLKLAEKAAYALSLAQEFASLIELPTKPDEMPEWEWSLHSAHDSLTDLASQWRKLYTQLSVQGAKELKQPPSAEYPPVRFDADRDG